MPVRKRLCIYKVTHSSLTKSELIVANNITEAIKKFNEYYELDTDIKPKEIISVNLEHDFIVIDEEN